MDLDIFQKLTIVISHIDKVRKNCIKLGFILIKMGETQLGRTLIANGMIHDNSKFTGIEFEHLFKGDDLLSESVKHHQLVNPHHPEYWGGIHNMPEVYLIEMVCDCAARSAEFGTDIKHFFSDVATKKYNFTMGDNVGVKIKKYIDLLYNSSF